jgi:hypothetical protein
VDGVRDLGMPEGKVYVGAADNDFVTWLGMDGEVGMGKDPAQRGTSAQSVLRGAGHRVPRGHRGERCTNHTSYFDERNNQQSVDTLGRDRPGRRAVLTDGAPRRPTTWHLYWAKDAVRTTSRGRSRPHVEEAQDMYDDRTEWVGDRVDDFTRALAMRPLGWSA